MFHRFFVFALMMAITFSLLSASQDNFSTDDFINHVAIAQKDLETMTPEELDTNWNLNQFFGCVFVINLPKATNRLKKIIESLEKIGVIEFEVMPAINGYTDLEESIWKKMHINWANHDLTSAQGQKAFDSQRKGEAGCYLSHLKILETVKERFEQALDDLKAAQENKDDEAEIEAYARAQKYSRVLILEDDNDFGIVNYDCVTASLENVGTLFRKAMLELPFDWKAFYLMARSLQSETYVSKHIVQLTRGILNNAYVVHHTFYDPAILHLNKINDPKIQFVDPYDVEFASLHQIYANYAITPAIAYQREGLSSITGHESCILRQVQPNYISGWNAWKWLKSLYE
jgi:hypothetical protein